jgi:BirA family transcriptional regulator, biotin operon repressor / biotin---[acetyl-CoA-carboxylase] ligase
MAAAAERRLMAANPTGHPARSATPLVAQVFAALSDGQFHSGEGLAGKLGVSRSAVWKATAALRELGATLHAVRNRGYQLPGCAEPLDAQQIRERLGRAVQGRVRGIETAWCLESTNTVLLARPSPPPGESDVLLAEYQSAGRGRRGRSWLAPPGGAVCLSLNWTFREAPAQLGALSLVVGVCILRALRDLGLAQVQLKWPNDLLVAHRKLGGVLIELRAESAGPAYVVIGIGLNVSLGARLQEQIATTGIPATDLREAGLGDASRNPLVAAVVSACLQGLPEFEGAGLEPFIEEWRRADALKGKPVNMNGAQGVAHGVACGIDSHGALLVQTPQGMQRFVSGDVSVRAV